MTTQAPAWRQEVPSEEDAQLYMSDDFRIWCMKIIPCTKRYVHDWSVCPFAHAGEKAVRRDPRTHEYTGIACPEMKRTGSCMRGDNCPYAHNVFEYWLHPTRYRTQLCNDGPGCSRSICFFAHNLDELRTPAVKPYASPEALARSSLAAIQQNPHPLAQQLASPFRTSAGAGAAGPAGRRKSSEEMATPTPGPFSAMPGGPQQGPWGTAAARLAAPQGRQAGQPAAAWHGSLGPATPRQLHQPQQPLRLSADYPAYIPGQGGHGQGAGFALVGQAGPPTGYYGGHTAAATPGNVVGGGLASQAGPSGMGSWVDAQQQGGTGPPGMAAPPGAWPGVAVPAGRGSWGSQDPYTAAGSGAWIPQGAGPMDPTAALHAALRLSSSSMSGDSAADMAALASAMSDASTHSAALLQAVLSGRLSGSSAGGEGIDPAALADVMALANRLSDASMSALSDRLSSESLLASAVGTPGSHLLTAQQGMGTAGEAAAAAAAGVAAQQLASAGQDAAASGGRLGPGEAGFAGALQRYGSTASLGASRRSIGGRSSRGSGDMPAEEAAATMASQEQMPGPSAAAASGPAPEEDLAQALANMKMALTHQQLAATTSTNHEVVISTLHQVLRDAAAQHASNTAQGAQAGSDPSHP